VLELAVAHELYERYPDFSEGRLAKNRSHVVSRASCAVVAREARSRPQARPAQREVAGRRARAAGEEPERHSPRCSRAALGALFLEHGFTPIEDAIVAAFSGRISTR
jgi:ribonuclease-3